MSDESKPVVVPLRKPSFSERFKSKTAPTLSGVATLLTALPIMRIGEAGDFVRTHPDEGEYWSGEMCFVSVPIAGAARDALHVIDEDIAVRHLPSKKIKRHRLALASKPHNVFFFCVVPTRNLENSYNRDALEACHRAQANWLQAMSRRAEGIEGYEIKLAVDPGAFPEPEWPARPCDELLEITFKGASIDSDNHPGLLRLIGAKQDLA